MKQLFCFGFKAPGFCLGLSRCLGHGATSVYLLENVKVRVLASKAKKKPELLRFGLFMGAVLIFSSSRLQPDLLIYLADTYCSGG